MVSLRDPFSGDVGDLQRRGIKFGHGLSHLEVGCFYTSVIKNMDKYDHQSEISSLGFNIQYHQQSRRETTRWGSVTSSKCGQITPLGVKITLGKPIFTRLFTGVIAPQGQTLADSLATYINEPRKRKTPLLSIIHHGPPKPTFLEV